MTEAAADLQASAYPKDQEEQGQRGERAGADVVVVLEREDDEHQDGRGDELGEKHAGARHEGGRVRAEDAGAGRVGVAGHGAHAVTLVVVDGRVVVAVHDGRRAHGAQHLRGGVDGEFPPRELAEDAVGEGYGGVDVAAGVAGAVHTEHYAESAWGC